MQNLNSFISSLCSVLIDLLSCGWNVKYWKSDHSDLLFTGLSSLPPLWLSLTWACVWLVGWILTFTAHFVLLCHAVGSEKNPKKRKTSCPFFAEAMPGNSRQWTSPQLHKHLHILCLPSPTSHCSFFFPFQWWECATQEFLPFVAFFFKTWSVINQCWWRWQIHPDSFDDCHPCHATLQWCSVIFLLMSDNFLRHWKCLKCSCLLPLARWKLPGFLFLYAAPRD